MPAAQYNLALEQGATFRLTITWTDNASAPIDLTGAHAHMQIRTQHANTDTGSPLIDIDDTSGITLGGPAGTIEILIDETLTAPLTVSNALYDLYITMPNGDRDRILEGSVTIDPQVTVA